MDVIDYDKLGRRIKMLRVEHGLKQAELADEVGVSQRWMSDIENGHLRGIKIELVTAIANALGRTREQLLKEAGEIDDTRVAHDSGG